MPAQEFATNANKPSAEVQAAVMQLWNVLRESADVHAKLREEKLLLTQRLATSDAQTKQQGEAMSKMQAYVEHLQQELKNERAQSEPLAKHVESLKQSLAQTTQNASEAVAKAAQDHASALAATQATIEELRAVLAEQETVVARKNEELEAASMLTHEQQERIGLFDAKLETAVATAVESALEAERELHKTALLQSELLQSERHAQDAQSENERHAQRLQEFTQETTRTISSLEEDVEILRMELADYESLKASASAAKQELDTTKQALASLSTLHDELIQKRQREHDEQREAAESAEILETAKAAHIKLQEEVHQEMETELEALSIEVMELQAEIKQLQTALEETSADAEMERADSEQRLHELVTSADDESTEFMELQSLLAERDERIAALLAEREAQHDLNTAQEQARTAHLEQHISDLASELQRAIDTKERLETELRLASQSNALSAFHAIGPNLSPEERQDLAAKVHALLGKVESALAAVHADDFDAAEVSA
jgi:myosin heavy subunit